MSTTPNKLNQGQQAAADGFFQFLLNPEQKELCISGPGGVGKTFMMGHMINEIMPQYFNTCQLMGIKAQYTEVKMTATTNKAADVLGLASGIPTGTIHSHMNLKVKDDYSTGKSILSKTSNWKVHQNQILFIDEASMIDTPLRKLVLEGTYQSKIVYVGDHCQLNPVMEQISPVYKANLPVFELTQPMRTDNPDLHALNQQMRNTVETGDFNPIKMVPGTIDWLSDDEATELIDQHFKNGNTTDRIVAYTNRRVLQFNQYIRDLRQLPAEIQVGEILINNSAVQLKSAMLSVEEQVTIDDICEDIESIMLMPGHYMDVRRATISTPLKGSFTDVPIPIDRKYFSDMATWFGKQKNWERYFYMKNTFPDLRERDAATIHKVQGSSHDTIIIDASDISECRNPDQAARLLYVAVSRARKRVVFHGQLADKFGGLIA